MIFSKVDLIISVSTGALVYISVGIVLAALVIIGVFLFYKYGILKIGKISLLGIIIIATLIAGSDNVQAAAPSNAKFTYSRYNSHGYSNNYGSRYFYGEEKQGMLYVFKQVLVLLEMEANINLKDIQVVHLIQMSMKKQKI